MEKGRPLIHQVLNCATGPWGFLGCSHPPKKKEYDCLLLVHSLMIIRPCMCVFLIGLMINLQAV